MATTAVLPSSPSRPSPNTPNAHPYAIKTTSTTLLSRSSSSAAQAANAVHRYVPPASPSPSPISANGTDDGERSADSQKSNGSDSMGMGRKGRHRYSRSLTDGPMPVPIPPGVTNNASSPYTGYSPSASPSYRVRERARSLVSEPDEEETPRRRPDGTLTSSSSLSMGPPATPSDRYSNSEAQFSLPEDPKSWSAAQVSGYLTSMLRGGEDDITGTVAAYVRAKEIGGKAFLRLSENELERSDPSLPPLAREALLRASRALRQNSLRDRMFSSNSPFSGTGNLDFNSRHSLSNDDHSGDEAELNAEGVTLRRRTARMVRPRTRSRNSSLSSNSSVSSSASGRVREMVDELERSSSQHGREMEEEGTASSSRSNSPTKSSFLHTSRHVEISPSKGRALPVRPTVNDLFSGPHTHHTVSSGASTTPGVLSEREVEAKETDETITRVAKKNVNGREPRLLPFPPTTPGNMGVGVPGGVLTPMHTGSGYPLPLSPEQLYLQQQYHGPGDYELGFRHAASPHAQTFVVRHGPSPSNLQNAKHSPNASSSGSGSGNALGKPTRLLPYPPVTSETALHHPRPRRAVGVNDRDADGAEASPPGTETEGDVDAAYVTALESQGSSNAASELSSEASSVLGGADEEGEELSVAELLAHPGMHGVSGAEAWEIELGDTVKRIGETHGAQLDSSKKTRASHKEIGRKAGRGGTGEKLQGADVGTGRNNKASLRRPGIMGLFDDVQVKPAEGGVGNVLTAPIDEEPVDLPAVNALESLAEDIGKDKEVERWEVNEKRVEDRIKEVEELAKEVDEKRREIEAEAGEIDARSKDIDERAKAVDEMREEVDAMSREVGERAKDIEERMKNLEENCIVLDSREHSLVSREEAVSRRERTIDDEVEEKTQSRETELNLKAQRVDETEAVIQVREATLEQRTRDVALREEAVWTKEETLDEREKLLRQAEQNLRMAKEQLSERETGLEIAEQELTARELRCQAREGLSGKEEDAPVVVDAENEEKTRTVSAQQSADKRTAAVEQTTRVEDRHSSLATHILRRCWGTFVLPVIGEEHTPAFLLTPATSTVDSDVNTKDAGDSPQSKSNRYKTSTWAIRRDAFLGRFMGEPRGLTDGYLVLMGIGMCVVVLRVLGRRGWAMRR